MISSLPTLTLSQWLYDQLTVTAHHDPISMVVWSSICDCPPWPYLNGCMISWLWLPTMTLSQWLYDQLTVTAHHDPISMVVWSADCDCPPWPYLNGCMISWLWLPTMTLSTLTVLRSLSIVICPVLKQPQQNCDIFLQITAVTILFWLLTGQEKLLTAAKEYTEPVQKLHDELSFTSYLVSGPEWVVCDKLSGKWSRMSCLWQVIW